MTAFVIFLRFRFYQQPRHQTYLLKILLLHLLLWRTALVKILQQIRRNTSEREIHSRTGHQSLLSLIMYQDTRFPFSCWTDTVSVKLIMEEIALTDVHQLLHLEPASGIHCLCLHKKTSYGIGRSFLASKRIVHPLL